MSQLASVRPLPRAGARRPGPTPRQLKVVAPPQIRGNGAFLALCILLLLGGFVGVLLLNTAMAQGSFTMRDLQQRSDELTDTQDSLRQSIDTVSGPGPLAKRARALGMVPAETAAFLRLSDGAVLGVAKKAGKNTTFRVVTEAQPPARIPVPTAATPTPTPLGAGTPSPRSSASAPGTQTSTPTATPGPESSTTPPTPSPTPPTPTATATATTP